MAGKRKLHPAVRAHYRKIGRKGGRARARSLTAWERSRIARLGAEETNRLMRAAKTLAKKTA